MQPLLHARHYWGNRGRGFALTRGESERWGEPARPREGTGASGCAQGPWQPLIGTPKGPGPGALKEGWAFCTPGLLVPSQQASMGQEAFALLLAAPCQWPCSG